MKKTFVTAALLSSLLLTGCGDDNDVGTISLGLLTFKDITVEPFVDPKVSGVTCHVSSINAKLSFSDPSNNSVQCHQTGPITPEMIAAIDHSESGEVIFKDSKSIFLKNLKIRRIYDARSQALLYVAYSTKELSGSFHHSLSTIPLWGTQAYVKPMLEPKVAK